MAVDPSTHAFGVPTEDFTPPTYGEYLSTSAGVYVCAKKRATLLASLPFELTKLRRDGTADPVTTGSLWELMQKVNPWWTRRRLIEMTEMSLCAWGAAYWYVNRGGSQRGEPKEIFWMRPDRVKVFPHPTTYVDRFEYQPVSGAEPVAYAPSEIVWLRYPNPLDEYSGLSPLAAARLAADTQSAAMKSNRQIFANGINLGGIVTPADGKPMGQDAAVEIKEQLQKRAKGTANAHRWMVLRHDAKFLPIEMSPKDAEYVALHKLTLEDIARAYGIPLDLIGGERHYENYNAAMKAVWVETIIPEASFIADELTEQLLPMFAGQADLCEFDHSEVEVLQDDEQKQWQIAGEQIGKGAIVVNEWRKDQGLDPLPWGDSWWAPLSLVPIKDDAPPELMAGPEPAALPEGNVEPEEEDELDRGLRALMGNGRHEPALPAQTRVAYGSEEHQRLFRQFVRRTEKHEEKVKKVARELFRQQQQALLTELGKVERLMPPGWSTWVNPDGVVRGIRTERAAEPDDADSLMAQIFNIARWRKRFRAAMKPVLTLVALDGGQAALDEVTVGVGFDVSDPNVARFLERRAQRFATRVNDTTWELLKASLAEGLAAGEGTDVLKERVRAVMGERIRSSAEVIARTETIGAYVGGYLEGAKQSGQVEAVQWLAALDDRTRETHVAAHGQTVPLGKDFRVGEGRGPGPGLIDLPEESIQCRCSLLSVLKPLGA